MLFISNSPWFIVFGMADGYGPFEPSWYYSTVCGGNATGIRPASEIKKCAALPSHGLPVPPSMSSNSHPQQTEVTYGSSIEQISLPMGRADIRKFLEDIGMRFQTARRAFALR
jgi:hypothetical protein